MSMRSMRKRLEQQERQEYYATPCDAMYMKMARNGITPKQLEEAQHKSYDNGWKDAVTYSFNAIYTAILLSLSEIGITDQKQAFDFLSGVDQKVTLAVDNEELRNEVFERCGVLLEIGNEMGSIRRRMNGKKDK